MTKQQLWELVVRGLKLSPAFIGEGRRLMRMNASGNFASGNWNPEPEDKARTYHNIECSRLRGGDCSCKMTVVFTPPRHFMPVDPIMYDDGPPLHPRRGA